MGTERLGKYELIRKLATGGMAEVFLARAQGHAGFEKMLVVKRILPHLAKSPQFVEMFLEEARLAARLNHPNIAHIFDFGEENGVPFLAMEYVEGVSLRVLVRQVAAGELSLSPAICAKLVSQACDGLAYAHELTHPQTGAPLYLIHRDVSPDNLLLSRAGSVKVVDFGIAKAADRSHKTQTGKLKGKLGYMAPEQIRGEEPDRRADIFALGVVLYELLTGVRPFEGKDDLGVMRAVVQGAGVPVRERRPDVPDEMVAILDLALAIDRNRRYVNCSDLGADLEEFILVAGRPVGALELSKLLTDESGQPIADVPTGGPRAVLRRPAAEERSREPVSEEISVLDAGFLVTDERDRPLLEDLQRIQTPTEELLARSLIGAPPTPSRHPTAEAVAPPRTKTPLSQETLVSLPPDATLEEPSPFRGPAPSRIHWASALAGGVLLFLAAASMVWQLTRSHEEPAAAPGPVTPEAAARPEPPMAAVTVSPSLEVADGPAPVDAGRPPLRAQAPRPPRPPPLAPPPAALTRPAAPPSREAPPRAEPPADRAAAVRPKEPAPRAMGKVEFRLDPKTVVVVDGKVLGETPMPPVELPEGSHWARFVNRDLGKELMVRVTVTADGPNVVRMKLAD